MPDVFLPCLNKDDDDDDDMGVPPHPPTPPSPLGCYQPTASTDCYQP